MTIYFDVGMFDCELASWFLKAEILKEYYEIVDEARPPSGFFPTHADLFTEMHF